MSFGPTRIFEIIGQLQVPADTQTTAQTNAETAVAAINTALAGLNLGVSFSAEKEEGQFVMSEAG